MENVILLLRVRDVGVNQQRICLAVDCLGLVLNGVEVLGLGPLNLARETHREILHDNAIRAGKEAEDILDKVALVLIELLPVSHVFAQIHLLSEPLHGQVVLGLLKQVVVDDGKEH